MLKYLTLLKYLKQKTHPVIKAEYFLAGQR